MQQKIDELVRDLTKVGSIPKSEARERIIELIMLSVKQDREGIKSFVKRLKFDEEFHSQGRCSFDLISLCSATEHKWKMSLLSFLDGLEGE
jgi:hypothetical protein